MNDGETILALIAFIILLIACIAEGIALQDNTGKYFCPECGERYGNDRFEYCLYDGTLLLERINY